MKKRLSPEQLEQLDRLAALPDGQINTADIPEAPIENWALAQRGRFYKPIKSPVTIRLDADVLAWFKQHASEGRYQTEINRVLRQHVVEHEKERS